MGARYYDPQVGRFISRDVVLSEHPYLYCDHDPVNAVDPAGYTRQTIQWYVNFVQALKNRDIEWIETLIEIAKPELTEVKLPQHVRDVFLRAELPRKMSVAPGRVEKVRGLIDRLIEHVCKIIDEPGAQSQNQWAKEIWNHIHQIGDKLKMK